MVEQDKTWGITVTSTGSQVIEGGGAYPPQNIPSQYHFSPRKGRVLDEYLLVFITRGNGYFFSESRDAVEVAAGTMLLLYPGEWHNYYPDKKSGWQEYWIGFHGKTIDEYIQNGYFNRSESVYNIGLQNTVVDVFNQAIEVAAEQGPGCEQMLSGVVNYLIGSTYSYNKRSTLVDSHLASQINHAKRLIAENITSPITPEFIAEKVNLSYSWFRKAFKQYTGYSPLNYIQEIRIRKSMELLTGTPMLIKEIAFDSGFNNTEYFISLFKKRTGYTPEKYRKFTRGRYVQ